MTDNENKNLTNSDDTSLTSKDISDKEWKKLMKVLYPKDNSKKFSR
jgi:hypothetical protein